MGDAMGTTLTRGTAMVTGASSGIGRAIATRLAGEGWRVFGTSRAEHAPTATGVEMLAMDVDDDASVARAVADLFGRTGSLDALVNCAGWALMGSVEDTSTDEARAQLETNFFGVLRTCRAVLPIMRRQRHGYIVNISSLSGVFGTPFSGLYSASKFAVEGLSEALRLETFRQGIRVVLIEPGDIQSQLPARRRTVRAAAGNDAYRTAFERFQANQAKDEGKAPKPDIVAALVARVVVDPSPRLRYSVGMAGQRIVVPLKRFLPGRLFEIVIRGAMGV